MATHTKGERKPSQCSGKRTRKEKKRKERISDENTRRTRSFGSEIHGHPSALTRHHFFQDNTFHVLHWHDVTLFSQSTKYLILNIFLSISLLHSFLSFALFLHFFISFSFQASQSEKMASWGDRKQFVTETPAKKKEKEVVFTRTKRWVEDRVSKSHFPSFQQNNVTFIEGFDFNQTKLHGLDFSTSLCNWSCHPLDAFVSVTKEPTGRKFGMSERANRQEPVGHLSCSRTNLFSLPLFVFFFLLLGIL